MTRRLHCLAVAFALVGCHAPPRPEAARAPEVAFVPRPAPQQRPRGVDIVAENARCVACHRQVASEWQGSLHARAYDDPVFERAFAIESTPFCQYCHAPEADPRRLPEPTLATVGVGCVTCHGTLQSVWGTRALPGTSKGHPVHAAPALSTPEACAACHQFDLPGALRQPMQNTVREHESSSLSGVPCQGCHLPLRGDHHDHRFSVQGDAAMLRRAVTTEVVRDASAGVHYRIEATMVGHAVPTGDIFRRIVLRVVARDANGSVLEEATPVVFERSFLVRRTPQGITRLPVADLLVPPPGLGPLEGEVWFSSDVSQATLEYERRYLRMPETLYEIFGFDAAADSVVLDQGTLQPTREPP
jgi:hypothetical protein